MEEELSEEELQALNSFAEYLSRRNSGRRSKFFKNLCILPAITDDHGSTPERPLQVLRKLIKLDSQWKASRSIPHPPSISVPEQRTFKTSLKAIFVACGSFLWFILMYIVRKCFPSFNSYPYGVEWPPQRCLQKPILEASLTGEPPCQSLWRLIWIFIGIFVSLVPIGILNEYVLSPAGFPFLFPSLGAAATVLFCLPQSQVAQPRNIFLGNAIAPFLAVSIQKLFAGNEQLWLQVSLVTATAITAMDASGTLSPPAGANAFLYVTNTTYQSEEGYMFILAALLGQTFLFVGALVFNNLPRDIRYPKSWI